MTHLIVDAHQDLAYNMITFARDYTQPIEETRRREAGTKAVEENGDTVLSWQEYQRGRVALIFATLFAAPQRPNSPDWGSQVYANTEQAHKLYMGQLDVYDRLFDQHPDKFTPVQTRKQLETTLALWEQTEKPAPTGLITLMEGGDGIRSINELEEWWQRGVRVIGPAWKATRFCGGTREPGPLTPEGHELLHAMAPLGFTLDLSHMDWAAALEALDIYEGTLIASHANALKQVKNGSLNRFLTDEIIDGVIERDGVIGVVPFNSFLIEGWKIPAPRSDVPLDMVVAQMDYICQRAGNAGHVAFGTDFDGGFGLQHMPDGLESIADLQKLVPLLEAHGYSQADIAKIFGGNWIKNLTQDSTWMNQDYPSAEINTINISAERVRLGLIISFFGLLMLVFGAKPDWFGLDRSPVVGFVQIAIFLIGLAIVCLGGYLGLSALWGNEEKSIVADIGSRLVSTGYVIALFSGMADVFGLTIENNTKSPFFGPWQEAGMEIGMLIIAIGILMIIPYKHMKKN